MTLQKTKIIEYHIYVSVDREALAITWGLPKWGQTEAVFQLL